MDKHQKMLMRKIRQAKRRRYGSTRQDDELMYEHESNAAQHEAATPEMVRLQGIIGNQAVQRLMGGADDGKQDGQKQAGDGDAQAQQQQEGGAPKSAEGSSAEQANALIDSFKESAQYSQLLEKFSKEDVTQGLDDLKQDAQQFLKMAKSKEAAMPLLASSLQQYLENKTRAKAQEEETSNPYPFLPTVQKSVNQVLSAGTSSREGQDDKINKLLKDDEAEATEEKTLEEREGGDFTHGKDPGEHIDDLMIQSLAGTKVSLEAFLKGYYKQLPDETLEDFQKLHDRIRTSSGYIAQHAYSLVDLICQTLFTKFLFLGVRVSSHK